MNKIGLLFTDINFSNENFPFMTFKTFSYKNTQARIMRASFTGELGYEIYISPKHALELWEEIFKRGKEFNLVPYGTETMHLLRAEKGYVVIGQETDGTVTPIDINFNWMIGKNKKDFIGKRSLSRSDTARNDRKQLVGVIPLDKSQFIEEGQHVVECANLPNKIKTPIKASFSVMLPFATGLFLVLVTCESISLSHKSLIIQPAPLIKIEPIVKRLMSFNESINEFASVNITHQEGKRSNHQPIGLSKRRRIIQNFNLFGSLEMIVFEDISVWLSILISRTLFKIKFTNFLV